MADLVIKINGDIKNFSDALERAKEKTEDLEGSLETIAKISGVAFAALTAEVALATHAFASQEDATRRLSAALQNQGIYTKDLQDQYRKIASEVQRKTGLDDDAVVRAQATIQAMIGQQKVTEKLTFAIADLAEAKGLDLQTSAELIGKGIEGQTMALRRLGIEIDDHLNKQERTAKILEVVSQKFGGQAEAANQGLGSIRGLKNAFGDFQEAIGERFAPIVTLVIEKLTKMFSALSDNKPLMDFIVSMTAAGAIVTGLGVAVAAGGMAFLQLKAALEAAEIATSAMSVATKGLIGATGLGLLLIIASEIYLNWGTIWPRMQAVYSAFVDNVSDLTGGLGKLLGGVFTFNMTKMKEGLDQVKAALAKGFGDATKDIKPIEPPPIKQDPEKAKAAAKQAAIDSDREQRRLAALAANNQLAEAEASRSSASMINLKKEEARLLEQVEDDKYKMVRGKLLERVEQIRQLEAEQSDIDMDQRATFNDKLLAQNEEFQQLNLDQQQAFLLQNQDSLQAQLLTEETARTEAAKQRLQQQIDANNRFLLEQQKFGVAYATINRLMHSEIYTGTKSAFGELAALQQSSNSTLKAIGKAAAIANIVIKTAESAMNIYAGFSTIPFIGQALGVAGAAAAIAFGAEQVGNVTAAAEGGLITGGIAGIDSVPVLAQQGELVAPVQNFDEVIGSVRAARAAEEFGGGMGGGVAHVILEFKGEAGEFIEAKLVERQRLNLSIMGT